MKTLIITIILGLASVVSSAQTSFFKHYLTDKDEYINQINELPNGNFLISGGQTESGQNRQAYLLLIDSLGNKIAEQSHPISDTSSIYSAAFFLPSETNTINIVNKKSVESPEGTFFIFSLEKINTETINTFYHRDYYAPKNESYVPKQIFASDSLIFVQSLIYYYPSQSCIGTLVSVYNFNFDSITSYRTLRTMAIGIVLDTVTKTVKSFTSNGTISVIKLSYDLCVIDSTTLATSAPPSAIVKTLNSEKYLVTFMETNELCLKQHIKSVLFSNQDIALDSAEYWNNPDSILFPGFFTNTILKEDTLFIVGLYKSIPSEVPYQSVPTYIQITKLDTNMNVISHYFFGGDAAYFPFKIIETTGGGLMISGVRYDHTNPTIRLCHPFALRLTSQGTLRIGENESLLHQAIVFPNPGGNQINLTSGIQLLKGTFNLYDINGRLVFESNISSSEMIIDVSFLSSGSYVWQIILNNNVMDKGKWIKR